MGIRLTCRVDGHRFKARPVPGLDAPLLVFGSDLLSPGIEPRQARWKGGDQRNRQGVLPVWTSVKARSASRLESIARSCGANCRMVSSRTASGGERNPFGTIVPVSASGRAALRLESSSDLEK